MKNNISGSIIAENARLFQNVRCINSVIGNYCCIGDDCDILSLEMEDKSELGRRNLVRNSKLGRGSYTGTNTILKNAEIGKYCSIAWNVSIGGGNHNVENVSMYTDYWYHRTFGIAMESLKGTNEVSEKVIIGNDVWIAAGVNIVNGVTIGDGCVIGAGAVVTKDIPPYSVVLGVPGKVVKKRFSKEIIDILEHIEWWNWSEEEIVNNINLLRNEPNVEELKGFLRKEI